MGRAPVRRATPPPKVKRTDPAENDPLLRLQRLAGNSAVCRLLDEPTHVPVGSTGDRSERAAHEVARRVAPSDLADRTGAGSRPELDGMSLDRRHLAATGPGRPLPPAVRTEMESAFGSGTDFGSVRIHTGSKSAEMAAGIGARAFTTGRDIHFGAGEFRPSSPEQRHVLAHELAHVASADSSAVVHRFPATALAGPIGWKQYQPSVRRPGEGVSGGVYILESEQDGDPTRVVVKPVFGTRGDGAKEDAEQLVFADQALRSLIGVQTPMSRAVNKGSKEFDELLELCLPKAPSGPRPGADAQETSAFVHLSQAKSFVVMSEVPKAKSLSSMVNSAGTDRRSNRELYDLVFSPDFLSQLGRVTVGDVLLGNNDRVVGRLNLGNIMVSMAEGERSVYSIDTTAILGEFKLSDFKTYGTTAKMLMGHDSTKSIVNNPGGVLDDVFATIVNRLRNNTKGLGRHRGATAGPADLVESTYKANRASLLASFEIGWDDAMARIFELVHTQEGRHKMRDLVGGFEGKPGGDEIQKTSLKTNAMYLAGRAQGRSHEEANADPYAYALRRQLQAFDVAELVFPPDGFHSLLAQVPRAALTADLPDGLASLPKPDEMSGVRSSSRSDSRFHSYDKEKFNSVADAVARAKVEAAGFGTKAGRKGEQLTNRAQAGRFLAECYGLGIGAARGVALAGQGVLFFGKVRDATGTKMKPNHASELLTKLVTAQSNVGPTKAQLRNYARSLEAAAEGVLEMRQYRGRKELAKHLTSMAGLATDATAYYEAQIQQLNLNLLEHLLQGMVSKG